jgi:hypothetical protein
MIPLEQKVRPHSEVVDTVLDEGEVVLLHLESKTYYSLNPTGERIWHGLKEGLSLSDISRKLQEEFDVEAERADRSILELVTELCEQKLAVSETRSS